MTNGNDLINPTFDDRDYTHDGLTKREYFAGLAMQGLLAATDVDDSSPVNISKLSLDYADALITALNQPPNQ